MAEAPITVSRETLRAELAEMELRLTRWVASADSVKSIDRRVVHLEESRIARDHLVGDVLQLEQDVKALSTDKVGRDAVRRFLVAAVGTAAAANGLVTGLIYFFA